MAGAKNGRENCKTTQGRPRMAKNGPTVCVPKGGGTRTTSKEVKERMAKVRAKKTKSKAVSSTMTASQKKEYAKIKRDLAKLGM